MMLATAGLTLVVRVSAIMLTSALALRAGTSACRDLVLAAGLLLAAHAATSALRQVGAQLQLLATSDPEFPTTTELGMDLGLVMLWLAGWTCLLIAVAARKTRPAHRG